MFFSLQLCLEVQDTEGRLFTIEVETGVLRVLFNEAASCEASVSQTRHSNVLVLLLSCAQGPPTPLSILVKDSLCCSVKGVVHRVV